MENNSKEGFDHYSDHDQNNLSDYMNQKDTQY